MKRLFHHILLLFTVLWFNNLFAVNSDKAHAHFLSSEKNSEVYASSDAEFKSDADVKQYLFIPKAFKDKIELSESEIETENFQFNHLSGTFSFFETYFFTATNGNISQLFHNGLAPCQHFLYLATIKSFCIIFCVYRI
ncbi:hypothetical protein [Flavobacterium suncheonense]|uniref:Uncharacterized protein n=1 Tax=Flavobacterium suncheonense GH29-5 = DSM 17707 TaxID=1121899 RepID=A0A0A2MQP5_9FLAO|nr:hypothetical protein [Flavobacterium suncheonense]KGO90580.1 hypothetical protein Q764_00205 [Flavobacterium suncheonense GH29-5 = DSM 17707]